jgi:hypothetical protein
LIRHYEGDAEVKVLRTLGGAMEMTWPLIKDLRPALDSNRILVHKWTAYVYRREALEYLGAVNPNSLFVLCVRDPARALVSWHNMHSSIARSGNAPSHFAWKERDFYADCSLSDYYERFARQRLQYDKYLATLLDVVPKERLAVVSQERLALGLAEVADYLKSLAKGGEYPGSVADAKPVAKHEGYADKANVSVDEDIAKELAMVKLRLSQIIARDILYKKF